MGGWSDHFEDVSPTVSFDAQADVFLVRDLSLYPPCLTADHDLGAGNRRGGNGYDNGTHFKAGETDAVDDLLRL